MKNNINNFIDYTVAQCIKEIKHIDLSNRVDLPDKQGAFLGISNLFLKYSREIRSLVNSLGLNVDRIITDGDIDEMFERLAMQINIILENFTDKRVSIKYN